MTHQEKNISYSDALDRIVANMEMPSSDVEEAKATCPTKGCPGIPVLGGFCVFCHKVERGGS